MINTPSEWTVLSMLEWSTSYFEGKGITNARFSIEWLLAFVLDVKRLDLYLIFDRPLVKDELEQLRPLIKRRASHEPLQYITGETDFFNTVIHVEPGVLIPRPETEQLVELALDSFTDEKINALDIGTGSGCIAIALKKNRPDWNLTAIDISDDALKLAQDNADRNKTKINFFKDNLFEPKSQITETEFELIVSNPPYILESEKETLDKEVSEYEPAEALFCDSTKNMYGSIEKLAFALLKKEGQLILELNEAFGAEVSALFEEQKWSKKLLRDYGGKDRFLQAKKIC